MPKKQDSRVRPGYNRKSNSICVVAYDLAGKPISPEVSRRVVKAVAKATEKEKLAISFTQE